jgi:5-enolpyruvylshikimate-3-phosphate synthase
LAPTYLLTLRAPEGPIAGSVPLPTDDNIVLCRTMLSLCSRGESSLVVRYPSRAVTCLFSALELLGLIRAASDERHFVRGMGLGNDGLPDTPTLDARGEAATAALLLSFLAGRKTESRLLVDPIVADLLGPFFSERGLALVESLDDAATFTLLPTQERWQGVEADLSGAVPWVKHALLLLGLRAQSPSRVSEVFLSADHLERALFRAKAPIFAETTTVTLHPPRDGDALAPAQYDHVGSMLCAAHLIVLPLCAPHGGRVTVRDVSANRSSGELWSLLRVLGADVRVDSKGDLQGEPIADVTLSAEGPLLRGATISGEQALRLGDAVLPLLVALARARGPSDLAHLTFVRGDGSTRILPRAVAFLRQAGFSAEFVSDCLRVGGGLAPHEPVRVTTGSDARLGLLGALLAVTRESESAIDDVACLADIFPRFAGTLRGLGIAARIREEST